MDDQGEQPFCYLTTAGRVSGRPHTIEIWFALQGRTLYVLSGGGDRSDWVRNLLVWPEVTVRIGRRDAAELPGRARVVVAKYQPSYGGDLSGWRRAALPVAVDLTDPAG
jgi:deazaflavin-dependent oxidoreductase (nitroreductase family)